MRERREGGGFAHGQFGLGEGVIAAVDEREQQRMLGMVGLQQHFARQLGAPGAARATSSVAITPPPPGRLSTTTVCPNRSPKIWPAANWRILTARPKRPGPQTDTPALIGGGFPFWKLSLGGPPAACYPLARTRPFPCVIPFPLRRNSM